jgi:hypothetical protein
MKKLPTRQQVVLMVVFIFAASFLIGCSSGGNLQSEVSGTWQMTQNDGTVEINLGKDPMTLKVNDTLYPATIEKIDKGNFSVYLQVQTAAGQTEAWTVRQIWNDNGSSFKIALEHNGTKEILQSKVRT